MVSAASVLRGLVGRSIPTPGGHYCSDAAPGCACPGIGADPFDSLQAARHNKTDTLAVAANRLRNAKGARIARQDAVQNQEAPVVHRNARWTGQNRLLFACSMILVLMGIQLLFGLLFGGTGDWMADLAGFCRFSLPPADGPAFCPVSDAIDDQRPRRTASLKSESRSAPVTWVAAK